MAAETAAYGGASSAAIQHHYDLSNAFFALWLDPSMTYSCAFWEGDTEPLEVAQVRKLDYLLDAAHLPSRARVLDVGCGWGSLARRAVERHGVEKVVGLTLSVAQAKACPSLGDAFEVRVENWVDHETAEQYDAVVSIGAFEHFARFGVPRSERVRSYRAFFERCHQLLKPKAYLSLQTISKGGNNRLSRQTVRDMRFVIDHVFPESELPWFAEILEASQGLFELMRARNDPDHYARTCHAWRDNLLRESDRAAREVGEATVRDYLRYLGSSAAAFDRGHLGLLRLSFMGI